MIEEKFDDMALKSIDALLRMICGADKFGSTDDILSIEDLDTVIGGVSIPDYQRFLQYVCERREKEGKIK